MLADYLDQYTDLVEAIQAGERHLYKVQIEEAQLKELYLPFDDEGAVRFYISDLYQPSQPIATKASGFSMRLRGITKLA